MMSAYETKETTFFIFVRFIRTFYNIKKKREHFKEKYVEDLHSRTLKKVAYIKYIWREWLRHCDFLIFKKKHFSNA